MAKHYEQYCPVAHALERVGERWSLLIVRELLKGPKRYTDLAGALPRIGTNVLAARLKDLEAAGVVAKRRLPPPTPAQVYELTPYGAGLKPVVRELALWGVRSLGAPEDDDELAPDWLEHALDTVFAPTAPQGSFEFRIGDEVASLTGRDVVEGSLERPDAIVSGDPQAFFALLVERDLDAVSIDGDAAAVRNILDALPELPARALS